MPHVTMHSTRLAVQMINRMGPPTTVFNMVRYGVIVFNCLQAKPATSNTTPCA